MLVRGQLVLNLNLKDPTEIRKAILLLEKISSEHDLNTTKSVAKKAVSKTREWNHGIAAGNPLLHRPENLDIPQAEKTLWASSGTIKLPKKAKKNKGLFLPGLKVTDEQIKEAGKKTFDKTKFCRNQYGIFPRKKNN